MLDRRAVSRAVIGLQSEALVLASVLPVASFMGQRKRAGWLTALLYAIGTSH